MHWSLRILLTWLILLPLALYFGEPQLMKYATAQAQTQSYEQCLNQTSQMPTQFPPSRPEIAEKYCNCVKSGVIVTRQVILAHLHRATDPVFQQRIQSQVIVCNRQIQL